MRGVELMEGKWRGGGVSVELWSGLGRLSSGRSPVTVGIGTGDGELGAFIGGEIIRRMIFGTRLNGFNLIRLPEGRVEMRKPTGKEWEWTNNTANALLPTVWTTRHG